MGNRSWWRRSLDAHLRSLERRRRIEEMRIRDQKERIQRQLEQTVERAGEATKRGEGVVGVDTLERRRISQELVWRGKWNTRMAKWDMWARKYGKG